MANKILVYFGFWFLALVFLMTFGPLNFFQSFGVLVATQFIIWANNVSGLKL